MQLLVAKETDLRATVHRDTLAMAQNYERAARMKLVRVNLVRAGLEVKGPKGMPALGPPSMQHLSDMRSGGGRSQGFLERFVS